jgi:hypothetical protein
MTSSESEDSLMAPKATRASIAQESTDRKELEMSTVAEPTTWERVVELLSDEDWHTEMELEEIAYFPEYWIRELEQSGYHVERNNSGRLRLLATPPNA